MKETKTIQELIEYWKMNVFEWDKRNDIENKLYCEGIVYGLKLVLSKKENQCSELLHTVKRKHGDKFCSECGEKL